jgi:hypothetical protein
VTTASYRLQMASGLQALLAALTNPVTSQPVYQAVQLGAFFNPAAYASFAEVNFFQATSGPSGSGHQSVGWKIRDAVTLAITSGWDYEVDSSAAMTNMLTAMDIVLPALHGHTSIPSQANPAVQVPSVYSVLTEQPDRAIPVRIPNGHVYLLWHIYVVARQEYNVQLTIP